MAHQYFVYIILISKTTMSNLQDTKTWFHTKCEKTNSNKTLISRLNHKFQEQQQVKEMILWYILLWMFSSNQPSYYNHHIAIDICIEHCKCIYKSFMSKCWQACMLIFQFWFLQRNVFFLLISVCSFDFYLFDS